MSYIYAAAIANSPRHETINHRINSAIFSHFSTILFLSEDHTTRKTKSAIIIYTLVVNSNFNFTSLVEYETLLM